LDTLVQGARCIADAGVGLFQVLHERGPVYMAGTAIQQVHLLIRHRAATELRPAHAAFRTGHKAVLALSASVRLSDVHISMHKMQRPSASQKYIHTRAMVLHAVRCAAQHEGRRRSHCASTWSSLLTVIIPSISTAVTRGAFVHHQACPTVTQITASPSPSMQAIAQLPCCSVPQQQLRTLFSC
jgi:hypothetical protein